jgi:hypothetical protein
MLGTLLIYMAGSQLDMADFRTYIPYRLFSVMMIETASGGCHGEQYGTLA